MSIYSAKSFENSRGFYIGNKTELNNKITTNNGRKISRHFSNRGIVIDWKLGDVAKKLFVYDEIVKNTPMLKNANSTCYGSLYAAAFSTVKDYQRGQNPYHPPTASVLTPFITKININNGSWSKLNTGNILYFVNNIDKVCGLSNKYQLNNGADSVLPNANKSAKMYSGQNGEACYGSAPVQTNVNISNYKTSSRILCNFWKTLDSSNSTELVNYARSITDIDGIDNLDVPSVRELLVILTEIGNLYTSKNILAVDSDLEKVSKGNWTDYGSFCLTSNTIWCKKTTNAAYGRLAYFTYNMGSDSSLDSFSFKPEAEKSYNISDSTFSFLVRDITDME